jgi:hypothetical protein
MGYTHYFSKVATSRDDALRFEMFSIGVARIIKYAAEFDGIEIADGLGEELGKWEADTEIVRFNGFGEDSHETFLFSIDGADSFNFCKTARKPYDAVVTACLIHMKDTYGDLVRISSDGDWSEWQDGARLYNNVTGLTAENPMSSEDAVA